MSGTGKSEVAGGDRRKEFSITRIFDAPQEKVWRAWTSPDLVAKWWGPKGWTTTTQEMDVRPGGVWRHVMRGPDGMELPNEIVFVEVVEPERLVYDHIEPPFHVVVTMSERGRWTELTMTMRFQSVAELEAVVKKYHADEGLKQTIGRLGEHLEGRTP